MAAALLAVLCSLSATLGSAQKVLHRATSSEPSTLDPHIALGNASSVIIDDLFMGLMTTGADGETVYGLAESHVLDETGTVYQFKLREGLLWSDGAPITASDLVYSFRRLMDPKTAARYAGNLYFLKNAYAVNSGQALPDALGVRAIDPRTLVIELEKPVPFFLKVLGANALAAVPAQAIETHGGAWARPGNMVASGPYQLSSWVPNTRIGLSKNPRFWDAGAVAIDQVNYYPTDDLGTGVKRFRTGELDIVLGFPLEQYAFLKKNYSAEINISPNLGLFYWCFNTVRPPFDDPRVRTALSIAVDREGIAEKLLRGLVQPAWGIVPPASAGYSPPSLPVAALPLAERQTMAQALLEEAGYGQGGKQLTLELRYDSKEEPRQIAIAISSMWKAIGVRATLNTSDFRAITTDIRKGNFDLIRYQWYAPYDDASTFLNLLRSGARTNFSKFSDPAYDALLERADQAPAPAARARLLQEAEALALAQHPLIPIYYAQAKRLVSQSVIGWKNVPGGNIPTRHLDISR